MAQIPTPPRKLLCQVAQHFEDDLNRAKLWFQIPNPVLNGMRPKDYYFKNSGGWKRLEKMIDDAVEETKNGRPRNIP